MVIIDSIQLAVFDLDDTLYPEAAFVEGGFRAVAKALTDANPAVAVQRMLSLLKEGRRDIFQVILAELNQPAPPPRITELVTIYRTADRPLRLHPDALCILERLRHARRSLAVLTDGPLEAQRTKVRLLDLDRRVDRIVYTDAYGPHFNKPCPHCFELLAGDFAAAPAQCVYVADNEAKDFFAPNALGWRTIKVDRPGAVYRQVPAPDDRYKPQETVDSLDKLVFTDS